ncbi:MAG: hypothetical protein A2X82_12110 [Geobacteraceae bacterium GWC2_55_20]|nr:MAG: hypothetical protein A2X82_12110 [Geobacteraceae bacterium GWC2_55_20]OGU18849.1 MAG: hypothetical protein A2X85_08875 [Geobacteraceae bacterium GWF2_54_21]HBA73371.1 hypothetical protein [Geobacter sp.]HCE66246.1 hypothetical protein [Geobacter sp.]
MKSYFSALFLMICMTIPQVCFASSPTVSTDPATLVTSTSATLNGTANPNNLSTTVTFEYGTTTSYGSAATAIESPLNGTITTPVTAPLSGLAPGTGYHYRVKGENIDGTGYGSDRIFTTSGNALFSDGFEGMDWLQTRVSGTEGIWSLVESAICYNFWVYPHGGSILAALNASDVSSENQTRLYRNTSFPLSSAYTGATLNFWIFHDIVSNFYDRVQVQISTDGVTWSDVGPPVPRYNGTTGWALTSIDLTPYLGQATLYLGFLGFSEWGSDIFLDDVSVVVQSEPVAPTVVTDSAAPIAGTAATLNGTVNANLFSTTVTFEYGTTTAYGSTAPALQSPVTGIATTAVSAEISGLAPGAVYHYRVKGESAGGTSYGSDQTFTTTTGGEVILLDDGFEGGGWLQKQVWGLNGEWNFISISSIYPYVSPHDGALMASLNSYFTLPGTQTRLYREDGFHIPTPCYMATLKFWMYYDSTINNVYDRVQVQISTNGSTWTNAGSPVYRFNTIAGWVEINVDLTPYAGYEKVYLGFLGISESGKNIHLDEVSVVAQIEPVPPTVITTDPSGPITSTSAILNGTANAHNSDSTITFEYGATTSYGSSVTVLQSPVSGIVTTSVSAEITGLVPGAIYHYRVKGENAGGSSYGNDRTFTTTTGSDVIIYNDGFETGGWEQAVVSGVNGEWNLVKTCINPAALPHSGYMMAYFNSYYTIVTQTRLFRNSGIPLPGSLTGATLKFWMFHDVIKTRNDQLQAQISTDGITWTNVGSALSRYNGTSGWSQASVDLTPYIGQESVYLGFLGMSGVTTNGNNIYLDDVSVLVKSAPLPPTITTEAVFPITGTDATLNGTVNAHNTATTVTFEYGTTTSYGSSVTALQNPVTGVANTPVSTAITGLVPGTIYHFRVKGENAAGISYGSDRTFTTTTGNEIVLLNDSFEQGGWLQAQVYGIYGAWDFVSTWIYPTTTPHSGSLMAAFNSYFSLSNNLTRLYRSSAFQLSNFCVSASLSFWMYHDIYDTADDRVQVQISTDGITWTDVGAAVSRYTGTTGWALASIDLTPYIGQGSLYLGLVGISERGSNIYLDDISISAQQIALPLSVTISGSGDGAVSVTTDPLDANLAFSCTTGTCTSTFPLNTSVFLAPVPSATSTFDSWPAPCSGDGICSLTMDTTKSVIATFSLAPVAMNFTTSTPYASLATALYDALPGAEIRILDTLLDGAVIMDKTLFLNGGWNAAYQSKSGLPTTFNGGLTLLNGDSAIESVDVKGTLLIEGGTMSVNDVKILP